MNNEFLEQIYFGNSLKNYLYFSVILLLGFLLKGVVSNFLNRILFRLFRRFAPGTESKVFVDMLLKPVEFLLSLVFIYLSINQLDYPLDEVVFRRTNLINNLPSSYELKLVQVVDKLFLLFFIISGFWIVLRIIDFVAEVFKHKVLQPISKSNDQMVPFIRELSKIITIIFAFFVILGSVFNLNVATIIAGLGIGGIAVALAAQDTLQNLLGSFTIFADKPFLVGDLIRIDHFEGTVEKVGFKSTAIRTLDKTLVIIPNKKMVDSPLENLSLRNLRRMKFNIGLRYDTSPEVMRKIAEEIRQLLDKHPATTDDTLVTFDSFGDSSLNIQILYFIEIVDYNEYMRIRQDFNYRIMEIVSANGAEFAFPSQTVFHEYVGEKPPRGAAIA